MFGIGRGEDVEGRAVIDLLRELRRGGVAKDHVDAFLGFEYRSNLSENISKVSGGRDGELPARFRGSLGSARCEKCHRAKKPSSLARTHRVLCLLYAVLQR
jgi:hypothetical protein